MTIKYFKSTDTALLEFSNRPVNETREISENVYVDLDKDGNLVSMTIEHANQAASLPSVVVEEFEQGRDLTRRCPPRQPGAWQAAVAGPADGVGFGLSG